MSCYLDINLQPDSEMPLNWLMNSVYTKLHKALWDMQSEEVGLSFPNYKVILGSLIRMHGSQTQLTHLGKGNWLGGMSGYCSIAEVLNTPSDTKHRVISRKQSTMSESKLRRLLLRGSISETEVKAYRVKMFSKGLDNPFVELVSASSGHKHRRYIELGPLLDFPQEGKFDSFGLSKTATVPWF